MKSSLEMANFKNSIPTEFGISMEPTIYLTIKRRLEELLERAPAHCSLSLTFEKRASSIRGRLALQSLNEKFISTKVAHDPFQAFLLIEEDIDRQILSWKRKRFSEKLLNSIERKKQESSCA